MAGCFRSCQHKAVLCKGGEYASDHDRGDCPVMERYRLPYNALPLAARQALAKTLCTPEGRTDLALHVVRGQVSAMVLWSVVGLWALFVTFSMIRFLANDGLIQTVPLLLSVALSGIAAAGLFQTFRRFRTVLPEGIFVTGRDILIHRRGDLYAIPRSAAELKITKVLRRQSTRDKFLRAHIEVSTAEGVVFEMNTQDQRVLEFQTGMKRTSDQLIAAMSQGDANIVAVVDPLYAARDVHSDGSGWLQMNEDPGPVTPGLFAASELRVPPPERPSGLSAQWADATAALSGRLEALMLNAL